MEQNELLRDLRVAKPCRMKWSEMRGNDRVRYCGRCELNVYNLANMTRDEAVELLQDSKGRVCTRFYRRADGTIMTADCPKGVRAAVVALRWPVGIAGLFLFAAFGAGLSQPNEDDPYCENPVIETVRSWPVFGAVVDSLWPQRIVMGAMVRTTVISASPSGSSSP